MTIRLYKRLQVGLVAAAVLLIASASSYATLTLSMPNVTVLPGATSAKAVINITNNGGSSQQITSINPALKLSTMMGTGTATFFAPGNNFTAIQSAAQAATNSIWPTGTPQSVGLATTVADPAGLNERKYSLGLTGATPLTLNAGETRGVIEITFALSGVKVGDVFQVDIPAGEGVFPGSTWSAPGGLQFNIAGSTPGKITAVPEPSAFALIGLVGGLTAVGNWYRKRRTAAKAAE